MNSIVSVDRDISVEPLVHSEDADVFERTLNALSQRLYDQTNVRWRLVTMWRNGPAEWVTVWQVDWSV